MTFKENDDFPFKVFAILLIIAALGFSCARNIEQAPKVCEAECASQRAKYDSWDFNWIFIECACLKQ